MSWIWTTRPGFEGDLAEELRWGHARPEEGRTLPSLVSSEKRPAEWPVFARAGFSVAAETVPDPKRVAPALAAALDQHFTGRPRAWLLQAWVPDADQTNPLAPQADALGERVRALLAAARPELGLLRVEQASDAVRYGGALAQLCLASPGRVLVGVISAQDSPTLAAGGRARSRMPKDAPSRAARKLVEAFEWIGRAPEPGDVAVDLGAAPGGWTSVLLEKRVQVIAVDPANLAPALRKRRGLIHLKRSAFEFTPEERVDWLLCDMAWRPLEVGTLLAKWGRRKWASTLVANVKLPMKQRVEFVERLRAKVREGWNDLRCRQLYHDRDEFTLSGWRT